MCVCVCSLLLRFQRPISFSTSGAGDYKVARVNRPCQMWESGDNYLSD